MVQADGGEDALDLLGPHGPGGAGAVLLAAEPGPVAGLGKGTATQPGKLLRGVSSVYHIGEMLHMLRVKHGYDGLARGEVFIDPGRNDVVIPLRPAA